MLTKEQREKIRILCACFHKRPSINTTLELLEDMDELEADLDRWKARAEALERALLMNSTRLGSREGRRTHEHKI